MIEELLYLLTGVVGLGVLSGSGIVAMHYIDKNEYVISRKEYFSVVRFVEKNFAKEITNYNKEIAKYCDEIKKLNLTDLQLLIKLIDDLWKKIDGYNSEAESLPGFNRVYLSMKKQGCCRHFAEDIAAKLNYINPKYNARKINVNVYGEFNKNSYRIPIKTKIIKNEYKKVNVVDFKNVDLSKYANHAVCAVDIPHKNITLIIDPTNRWIGYMKGGKILQFDAGNNIVKYNKNSNFTTNDLALSKLIKYDLTQYIRKIKLNTKIEKLYGIESQKASFNYIRDFVDDDEKSLTNNDVLSESTSGGMGSM